jgi:hypothetical protein
VRTLLDLWRKGVPYLKNLMTFSLGLLLLGILSACAKPPVIIEHVLILNNTAAKITEVSVRHEPTNRYGTVNAILPGQSLELGLGGGGQPLLARQALVQWRDGNHQKWSVPVILPKHLNPSEKPGSRDLIYLISPYGQASVQLQNVLPSGR